MTDNRRSQLEMRWIPVTDRTGRTRMEAVWIVPTTAADRITEAA
jgi:hypothetical protein